MGVVITYGPKATFGPDAWFQIPEPISFGGPLKALPIPPPQRRDGHHAFIPWWFLSNEERTAVKVAAGVKP